MTRAVIERVDTTAWTGSATRHWAGADLDQVAAAACRAADLAGTVLPLTSIRGAAVMAVTAWDLNAVATRDATGSGPILERVKVGDLVDGTATWSAPRVLTVTAFLSFGRLDRRRGMGALTGYSRVVALAPTPPGAGSWELMECDLHGYTVVEVAADCSTRVQLQGPAQVPPPSRDLVPVEDRLISEQLFDVARRSGRVPPL